MTNQNISFVKALQMNCEDQIVKQVINDAIARGYTCTVECESEPISPELITDAYAVFEAVRSVDEAVLKLYKRDTVTGLDNYVGCVVFVFGNSPSEVIADATDNHRIKTVLLIATKLAEAMENAL